jgi:hypothetical protein
MAIEITAPQRDLPRFGRESRRSDVLWQIFGWVSVAAVALITLAITTQSDLGSKRLIALFTAPQELVSAVAADGPPRAADAGADTHALEAQVRSLIEDRDRLAARIATLEHSLDDVTGSIQRQPTTLPMVSLPVLAPVPAPSAPAITVAAKPAPSVINPLAMPATSIAEVSWPRSAQAEDEAPAVPLPPKRLAALPANETAAEAAPAAAPAPPPPAHKVEYGIELANAPSIELLRGRWAAVKANYGPLLSGLQPVAVHDRRSGATNYLLVAGPLPNFAAAAQVCSRFSAAHVACRPAKFSGQSIVQR